jgi:hypothetical protein
VRVRELLPHQSGFCGLAAARFPTNKKVRLTARMNLITAEVPHCARSHSLPNFSILTPQCYFRRGRHVGKCEREPAPCADFAKQVVVTAAYETTDPTVESQILNLRAAGVDVLMIGATPKFAAQAIRRTAELGWKPLQVLNIVSSSISATIKPAGAENAVGVITSAFSKDPGDIRWAKDQGMKEYRAWFAKYLPGADVSDVNYITGYNQGGILEQLLKQCGDDLSRENINKQAHAIRDLVLPMVLPGIKVTTSQMRNAGFTQLQLQRWTGEKWELFGDVIGSAGE